MFFRALCVSRLMTDANTIGLIRFSHWCALFLLHHGCDNSLHRSGNCWWQHAWHRAFEQTTKYNCNSAEPVQKVMNDKTDALHNVPRNYSSKKLNNKICSSVVFIHAFIADVFNTITLNSIILMLSSGRYFVWNIVFLMKPYGILWLYPLAKSESESISKVGGSQSQRIPTYTLSAWG